MKKRIRNLVVILVLVVTMGSVVMFCTPESACNHLQRVCDGGILGDAVKGVIKDACATLGESATQGQIACIHRIHDCNLNPLAGEDNIVYRIGYCLDEYK